MAGFSTIPAMVRQLSDVESLEIALIENLQRENLNPLDTAEAYDVLIEKFSYTHEELAKRIGKDRSNITNYLRLLKLPDEVRSFLYNGSLTMGHAKAVLSIDGKAKQIEAARKIIKKGLNVREAELLSKKMSGSPKARPSIDPQIASLEEKLIRHLGMKVRIINKGKKGKIEIEYYSFEELERLLDILL
jgi:ParB family chromosome partitioning protein